MFKIGDEVKFSQEGIQRFVDVHHWDASHRIFTLDYVVTGVRNHPPYYMEYLIAIKSNEGHAYFVNAEHIQHIQRIDKNGQISLPFGGKFH